MQEAEEEPDSENINLDPVKIEQRVNYNKGPMLVRGSFTNQRQVIIENIDIGPNENGGGTTENIDRNYMQSDLIERSDFRNIEDLTHQIEK